MAPGKLAAATSANRQVIATGAVGTVSVAPLQADVAGAAVGQLQDVVVGVRLGDAVAGAAGPQWKSRRFLSHWSSLRGGWRR
jgi:hypothetical protein